MIVHPLLYQYVVSLGSTFAIWENLLRTKLRFQCFSANDIIVNRVYQYIFQAKAFIIEIISLTPHLGETTD